jgi:cytosine/adenosine deaminase-related metal-dependent hydrolase/ubiquinone/menaquinone biosynthesis C-methylase UbiE
MSSAAKVPLAAHEQTQQREFAIWARSYDELPNPLLALEGRFLPSVLCHLRDKDVLDVGCGTGRWLDQLHQHQPHSLTGIDYSSEMVARARRKLAQRADIAVSNATSLPVASQSQDVILASFVASYVPDMDVLARELRRVCRTTGRIYISDVHPETAAACHWKRGMRGIDRQIEPASYARSLAEIVRSLGSAGFRITCLLEPPFGVSELEIFRSAAKLEAFHAAAGLPAIYILEATPDERHTANITLLSSTGPGGVLSRARIAVDSDNSITSNLELREGRIATIAASGRLQSGPVESANLHLNGYLLLPGLINAHDHLEFGLYPNLGHGPYQNSSEWAKDIQKHESATIVAQQSVPRDVRLWWGALRNLLCGVTTVCHHNPLHPELLADEFPIGVSADFGWAHSLAMDPDIQEKFTATPNGTPFVLHACEGIDGLSADEVFELDRLNALDERTVVVHGLALGPEGTDLINCRGSAVAWCPTSNRYLFGRTHGRAMIAGLRRVVLGSDSPLTAAGDLLDEIRIAHDEVGVPARDLYRMIFENAPHVFRLREGQGAIRPGAIADLIAVRDRGLSPAETVATMSAAEVELVMVRGRVQLASEEIYRRLPPELSCGLRPLAFESHLRWVRAPMGRLFREAQKVVGCKVKIGGKRVTHVCSAWL